MLAPNTPLYLACFYRIPSIQSQICVGKECYFGAQRTEVILIYWLRSILGRKAQHVGQIAQVNFDIICPTKVVRNPGRAVRSRNYLRYAVWTYELELCRNGLHRTEFKNLDSWFCVATPSRNNARMYHMQYSRCRLAVRGRRRIPLLCLKTAAEGRVAPVAPTK